MALERPVLLRAVTQQMCSVPPREHAITDFKGCYYSQNKLKSPVTQGLSAVLLDTPGQRGSRSVSDGRVELAHPFLGSVA